MYALTKEKLDDGPDISLQIVKGAKTSEPINEHDDPDSLADLMSDKRLFLASIMLDLEKFTPAGRNDDITAIMNQAFLDQEFMTKVNTYTGIVRRVEKTRSTPILELYYLLRKLMVD